MGNLYQRITGVIWKSLASIRTVSLVGASVQWLPQGVFVSGQDTGLLLDPMTGKFVEWRQPEPVSMSRKTPLINDITFAPDGRRLASIATDLVAEGSIPTSDSRQPVLHVANVDGSNIKQITKVD